jgi:hypothetical protein
MTETTKPVFEPLRPLTRNNALTAIQATMIAIARDDPDAARRCAQIALDAIGMWMGESAAVKATCQEQTNA